MFCIQMKSSCGWLSVTVTKHSRMTYESQEEAESMARMFFPDRFTDDENATVRVVPVENCALTS